MGRGVADRLRAEGTCATGAAAPEAAEGNGGFQEMPFEGDGANVKGIYSIMGSIKA